ncbi:ribosome small subunit-dependent GTPase A [Allosphingosinicella deserti]|uniref:ribosome small subunit-dependent GTPase A n=1 Tax=Allosphingosinicella deserti TaxID=2116704 RepID=UPI0018EDE67A|nr:ribosome small subunit-dependent GTPase A [Sphingomonas deserti]
MEAPNPSLLQLGWTSFFGRQVSAAEDRACEPVRVISVHRGMVTVLGEAVQEESISSSLPVPGGPEDRPTVGDWLLIDRQSRALVRLLARTSLFKRPAPGDDRRVQLIAANVDTLFVVTSCNQDFNVARIERYLVVAREAGVHPVIVLTKADLAPDPQPFLDTARALQPGLDVVLINGRDPESAAPLSVYCGLGKTVALVGSSGVGKSTLVNTLRGSDGIETQPVRQDDGKGLHTTTVREMHRLGFGAEGGGWLVDTPGMREFGMAEVAAGVAELFDDIVSITRECRFTNCTHGDEPGCALREALAQGTLEAARVDRWRKLADEDALNTASAATRRARSGRRGKRK